MESSSPFSSFDPEGHKNDDVKPRRSISIRFVLPNVITILAICAGVSSIRLAFEHRFETAILMVLLAAVLDGVDGRLARLMGGGSSFGAQMDSLADVVNFGVAPALIVYSFLLNQAHQVGWIAALVYCIACCLRLARFNVMIDNKHIPRWQREYFVGVPAPAGALLVLLPIYLGCLGLEPGAGWALVFSLYTVVIAFLLISRLPVWNGKTVGQQLRRDVVIPGMLVVVIYVGFLATYTWQVLLVTAIGYMVFLPFSLIAYQKRSVREAAKIKDGVEMPDENEQEDKD
ncbi:MULTISPECIES: CDP-diacylglycerol--serine O-phosphatidyltransferase [Bartonella]|uniref:CDP-diacylglycerol--serine O-phosphatidyltransferase n=1 Tax=Bartonella TaxID=773 RepID=UPI000965C2BA|nr:MULTISPECIES: CDP-diacylglycerol--serine O-phosphatidyltransferase [Bartonella]MBI0169427.1 CDP-diacylglycerol--serine O-phosphatidyltransferase [Bartonella sp. W8167]MBI0174585.1 CDP-diacylglycerol--serine O-phosphatidyltransferase [Bartonella apis]OLY47859.1 CDP-diacylglycerol---serine O-phosphatidyltransferase [Bartonella apis]